MYNYYYLTTMTLNISGGASATTEALTKEVEGNVVPCTEEEAMLKMFNKISSVGGNKATQSIRCILLNTNGDVIKLEEVKKPIEPTAE